jgi:hypothetical protein
VRNLLGPALEFVFGLKTLVVWPPAYQRERALIREWMEEGTAIGALTIDRPLEDTPGTEDFEILDHPVWYLRALGEVHDTFPSKTFENIVTLSRYAAGPRSDPLYEFWRREGERMTREICDGGVRLLGGNRFLVRHVVRDCPAAGVSGRTVGYLVGDSEAAMWQATLEIYGARFVRRDLGEAVLFDQVQPQSDPEARPLSPSNWTLEASDGQGSVALAVDGRLDTRWASQAPQRPGMTFTVRFPEPTDVSWLRIRMGRFRTDRASVMALDTSVDGERWTRREIPKIVDGIRWQDGLPEENSNGDVDLWVNDRGLRALRIVGLGESSRFDWSVAELEIDGRPSPGHP